MPFKNNKQIGEMGERVSIGKLAQYGIDVLLPMSDNLPFDFVIFHDGKFFKCQVKTTNEVNENNSYRFSLTSNNWNKQTEYIYNNDDYDILICCNLDDIFLFKFSDVEGKKNIYIRDILPKNNQIKGIVWAKDCVITENRLKYVLN